MKSAGHKRLGSITVLSLLALLAIAIGAQPVFAGPRSRSAAGTQGSTGVAAVSASATPAQSAAATSGPGLVIRVRGGVPRPVSGAAATPASAATTSDFGVWLAVGVVGAVLLVSIVAWASYRRRGEGGESSLAAFCALHPDDAVCRSA
jgi:hypothetical protein